MRRCIQCGTITRNTRCLTCQRLKDRARNKARPHYQGDYRTRAVNLKRDSEANSVPCQITPCLLPGVPIDYTHAGTPASYQADHLRPSDPTSPLRPSHARCNEARGGRGNTG